MRDHEAKTTSIELQTGPIPGAYYDTYYDWDNDEGWLTYECQGCNPDGEPVPGPGEPTAELADVEFEDTAILGPESAISEDPGPRRVREGIPQCTLGRQG